MPPQGGWAARAMDQTVLFRLWGLGSVQAPGSWAAPWWDQLTPHAETHWVDASKIYAGQDPTWGILYP